MVDSQVPDSRLARRRADRSAGRYPLAQAIPDEIGDRLLDHLDPIVLSPARILDLGSANGHLGSALVSRFPRAQYLGIDHSRAMLALGAKRWRRWFESRRSLCADVSCLPVADKSAQLLVSNLVLHWAGRVDDVLKEWARVSADGSLLLFSTYGPDTLMELRESFQFADLDSSATRYRFLPFADMHEVGDLLVRNGFTDPVMESERITLEYQQFDALASDLRALGATSVVRGRPRGLLGTARFARMLAHYETHRRAGRLPATLEVVYGHAWRGSGKQPSRSPATRRIDVALR